MKTYYYNFITIIFIVIIVVIIIIYLYIINSNQKKILNNFLFTNCKKGKCYNNLKMCTSLNGYVFTESNTNKNTDSKIERRTMKCILEPEDKDKLLALSNIFVPSIFNGTYCDIIYTTYYDFVDLMYLKNRMYNLNLPLAKCIRIRSYKFNPNTYFEIKYPGGTKLRALIDKDFNLLKFENIDNDNKQMMTDLLNKIKNKTIVPLFDNIYKRLSFIYKNNPSIRVTIDTNIEFIHNNIYHMFDKDILELKIPNNISIGVSNQYIAEINRLAGVQLTFNEFSKLEYYYNMIVNQNK